MRGIVVQQDLHYGVVLGNFQPLPHQLGRYPQQQHFHTLQYSNSNNIVEGHHHKLFQVEGSKKSMGKWKKTEQIMLTTQYFDSFPLSYIMKLKLYRKSEINTHHILKISFYSGEFLYSFPIQDAYQMLYKTFWAKLATMNIHIDPSQDFINSCDGDCLKKSEILGEWQLRYILITLKDGLMSFRNRNDAPTLKIKSTNELWTRFLIIGNQRYIVFKFWYGIVKQEIGVPLEKAVKWLKAFHSLLRV